MTYSEAIEKVMRDNGGFAPLKLIYQNITKYRKKTGKTPDNTIQERVQRDKKFTRIEVGVYALTSYFNKLPTQTKTKDEKRKIKREHSNIQGMLLQIGNKKEYSTYTPDKKSIFKNEDIPLGSIATLEKVPLFTYKDIIKKSVKFVDVIWFNKRGFPHSIFEVEHSTDFRSALVKFSELQDFRADFYCIAPESRKDKFGKELNKFAFNVIADRVKFQTYEEVENDYDIILQKTYL